MTDGVIFVHGGAHTKECWSKVIDAMTIPAIAVDLPGRGARPLRGAVATLDASVDAILEDAARAGFERFGLVGHSLGGIAITEAANRVPDRVTHLVYLDAVVYVDGLTQCDFNEKILGYRLEISDPAEFLPLFDRDTSRRLFMSELSDEEFEAAYTDLVPEPLGSLLMTNSALPPQVPATYVYCRGGAEAGRIPKDYTLELLRRHFEDLDLVEVEANHDVMLSRPAWLRDVIERAVGNGAPAA